MASVSERVSKDGRKAFIADIIRRRFDTYRESQSFDNRKEVEARAKTRG